MTEQTRLILLVPGATEARWSGDGLTGVEVEWVTDEAGFAEAFRFGTVEADLLAELGATTTAAVASLEADLRTGQEAVVAVVERLRDAGGLAVRIEQSGLGWEVSRWLEIFSADDARAWHQHAIVFLGDDDAIQSCGMHAFSLPDVRIQADPDAQRIGEALDVYQLAEDPVLRSGETFQPDADTPRRVLHRWPDLGYPADHPCHNPYGVWRLGPPGSTATVGGDLDMVFVPALRLVLGAAEQQDDVPLDEQRVTEVRDGATCIAMEPRHARDLERSRGYADLDPELAWEQWRALRAR
ncbi:hypothetical protein ABFT23_00520 [Nocardioides sp. C4-1]|uniref:hypothetical protein n=1 Tax=Nocardioides sp. C4-1 TaxID=3151851 RepID=UPI00326701AD